MTEYILLATMPLDKKKEVTIINFDDYENAIKVGNGLMRKGRDVIIVKKIKKINSYNKKEEDSYTLEKYGYYKTYHFINILFLIFTIILFLGLCYLYFIYKKQ
jgi:hypothetical protein